MKCRLILVCAASLFVAACGSSSSNSPTASSSSSRSAAQIKVMPDVKGQKLDVALSDIKRAGFEDKVDVVGGGIFGVVVKSNWEVCGQCQLQGRR